MASAANVEREIPRAERRRTRVALEAKVRGRVFAVQLYDISLTGCKLDSRDVSLSVGDKIVLKFAEQIKVAGKIMRQGGGTAGVKFDVPLHDAIAAHLGFSPAAPASGGEPVGWDHDAGLEESDAGMEACSIPVRKPIPASALRVLVVDDDDIMRKLMRRTLERMGFVEIYAAMDGSEGLALARSQVPDIILSDYEMPDKHGLQLLKAVREETALDATAFIMLSGVANDEVTAKARELGANDHIVKPFFADDLKRRLEAVVSEVKGAELEWPARKVNEPSAKTARTAGR